MTNRQSRLRMLGTLLLFAPLAAWAHAGGDGGAHHGFVSGLLHPLTGLDHMVAMLSVGLWNALTLTQRPWAAPLGFTALLLVGAMAGHSLVMVEPMIAVSLLVLGLLVAARMRMNAAAGTALVGFFALFHGAAHGNELAGAPALAGMALGSVWLHGAGYRMGCLLRERGRWGSPLVGSGVALVGASLLLSRAAGA